MSDHGAGAPVVLAFDEGTTSARTIAVDRAGNVVAVAQREFEQRYPAPGDVRHDPETIWDAQLATAREVIAAVGGAEHVIAIGITNQRETAVVWDRSSGRAVADAIVWQSRVTAPFCEALRAAGHEELVRARTGLPIDAYFSGPKFRQILVEDPALRPRAQRGELAAGTVESFLIWRLTGGRTHVTDVSNAARTLLLDIHRGAWDEDLVALMEVPPALLPEVRSCAEVYAQTDPSIFGRAIPIAAAAGDQQAATFGQACFAPGEAKVTLGTGAFLLANTGEIAVASRHGLLTTVAWQLGPDAPRVYALEGSVFVTGAAVQWLRDGLGLLRETAGIEALAGSVADSGGVVIVPAFVGLGAPYWDPDARGAIFGLTRGSGAAHLARATLDAIAQQVRDVVEAMDADLGSPLLGLRVDGGGAGDLVCGLIADQLGRPVERPVVRETTAFGVAAMAGLAVGFWNSPAEIGAVRRVERRFEPSNDETARAASRRDWRRAVERSRGWAAAD
ncbi:MAG TPA: glycerol kinase GlpK [Candidatus Limnocylindrales bacterium]|nr:glycerol kinase GlpK [Candidatus Limnocylindrales bacterium]